MKKYLFYFIAAALPMLIFINCSKGDDAPDPEDLSLSEVEWAESPATRSIDGNNRWYFNPFLGGEPKVLHPGKDERVTLSCDGDCGGGGGGRPGPAPFKIELGDITSTDYYVPQTEMTFSLDYEGDISDFELVWSVANGTIISGQGTPDVVVSFPTGGTKSLTIKITIPNYGILDRTKTFKIATGNDLSVSIVGSDATITWNGPTCNGSESPWSVVSTESGINPYNEIHIVTDFPTVARVSVWFGTHPMGLICLASPFKATYTYGPITETKYFSIENPNLGGGDPGGIIPGV